MLIAGAVESAFTVGGVWDVGREGGRCGHHCHFNNSLKHTNHQPRPDSLSPTNRHAKTTKSSNGRPPGQPPTAAAAATTGIPSTTTTGQPPTTTGEACNTAGDPIAISNVAKVVTQQPCPCHVKCCNDVIDCSANRKSEFTRPIQSAAVSTDRPAHIVVDSKPKPNVKSASESNNRSDLKLNSTTTTKTNSATRTTDIDQHN